MKLQKLGLLFAIWLTVTLLFVGPYWLLFLTTGQNAFVALSLLSKVFFGFLYALIIYLATKESVRVMRGDKETIESISSSIGGYL